MSLAEVAAWIRSTFRHADGTLDEEFESIVEHLKADPEFNLPARAVEARDVIQKDPHDWGRRPCATCARMSELLGVSFGCRRLHEILGGK